MNCVHGRCTHDFAELDLNPTIRGLIRKTISENKQHHDCVLKAGDFQVLLEGNAGNELFKIR